MAGPYRHCRLSHRFSANSIIALKKLSFAKRLLVRCVRCMMFCFYRIRVHGGDNVPREGGVLIVPNHVSWFDGFLVMAIAQRPIRAIVYGGNFKNPLIRWWAGTWKTVIIEPGPKKIIKALKEIQLGLKQGDSFLLFAEGGISRTGQIRTFRAGMIKALRDTDAKVVPVYLDELWGSIFSFSGGRFFKKFPRHWRYPVSVHYGKPLTDVQNAYQVRQAVQHLGAIAVKQRQRPFTSLPMAAVRRCKQRLFASKFSDSTGADVTGANCLIRTMILRRLLRRHVLKPGDFHSGESCVGLLLPPSIGAVLANLALAFDRRTTVNLNYTHSADVLNVCIAAAKIKHVLTSRQVMSKLDLKLDADIVYLDEFKTKVTLFDKIVAAVSTFAIPSWLLSRMMGLGKIRGGDLATIIFTSGSTGTPKGVELTFDNIASNVEAIDQTIHLTSKDVVLGILPFFHSFGYTVTLWTPAALNMKAVYHYSPIDGKRIGMLAKKHQATVLLTTPTFLRNYLKRCTKEQFETLDVIVAGAEKLPVALCDAFEAKFGVRPVEGYGCTELSPLACVNIPPSRSHDLHQIERKEGTVGRPVPNVAARVVDLESGEELPAEREGMLQVKGPNVMKGYLDQPEKTAEVVRDGWYVTGDVALIDDDGFVRITGRESRFSKIGGEMVPHIQIEETLAEIIGDDQEEAPMVAVTAVPDEKKGERLVVLYQKITQTPDELREQLLSRKLPTIYVPSAEDFHEVDKLPVLGTGKLDLKGIKQLALTIQG